MAFSYNLVAQNFPKMPVVARINFLSVQMKSCYFANWLQEVRAKFYFETSVPTAASYRTSLRMRLTAPSLYAQEEAPQSVSKPWEIFTKEGWLYCYLICEEQCKTSLHIYQRRTTPPPAPSSCPFPPPLPSELLPPPPIEPWNSDSDVQKIPHITNSQNPTYMHVSDSESKDGFTGSAELCDAPYGPNSLAHVFSAAQEYLEWLGSKKCSKLYSV